MDHNASHESLFATHGPPHPRLVPEPLHVGSVSGGLECHWYCHVPAVSSIVVHGYGKSRVVFKLDANAMAHGDVGGGCCNVGYSTQLDSKRCSIQIGAGHRYAQHIISGVESGDIKPLAHIAQNLWCTSVCPAYQQ